MRFVVLYQGIIKKDRHLFQKYTRMSPERFDQLLQQIRPIIQKKETNFREAIPAEKKLVITLRFLSRGIAQETLAHNFRVGASTVSNLIKKTNSGIEEVLSPIYLSPPSTPEQWKSISNDFRDLWNMPYPNGQ